MTEKEIVQTLKRTISGVADLMNVADKMHLRCDFSIGKTETVQYQNKTLAGQFEVTAFRVTKDVTDEIGARVGK